MRQHPENFIFASSDRELVKLASEKKIQGFFADKTQMELLLWRTGFHSILTAAPMQLTRIPVYYLMSKKTIQPEFVDWFDKRLQALVKSSDYRTMVRKYSVPLFIAMTTDTLSYHILEILGTMFYAISGLILAKEARFSLTGAFILAMLPGIGGGLMRDIMLDRDPVGVLRTPSYFMTVVATTLVFYTFIRVRQYIKSLHKISDFFHDHMFVKEFSIVRATDAVGLAVFTIIGVMVAVEVQATPLWLWGPIIAVLSSTGGGIVRDFFLGRELNRTFFYETAFMWSFLLTAYIIIRTESISPDEIFYAILVTLVGIISTRIFILKKGWLTKEFWLE
jgi:polar amino acid transport system substrate-binding protein